jgi:MFS transporter, YNFM family, putative membrane transport protein
VLEDVTHQAELPRQDGRLRHGDPGMRRVRLGLFAAGLATFALLYTPQPLLPLLSASFLASPAMASLAMSAGTGALAIAIIPVSSLSEVFGRRRVMIISALAAAVLGLVAPLSPSLGALVAVRVAQGFALAGVPAVAMAYLAEEVDGGSLGQAMGLYIAGNAIGGLSGRIVGGVLAGEAGESWRVAQAGVSALALGCAVAFAVLLPRSVFFTPVPLRVRGLLASLRRNLADPGLLRLYLIGFALMGAFVTVYNYLTFRLSAAPFRLSPTVIGALFVVYLAGTYSSAAAGRLADRFGRYFVLVLGVGVTVAGVLLTLPASLPLIVAGLIVMTAGFFAAHSVASGWVGGRATVAPAQASALYLCLYYIGSSVAGSAGGVFYGSGGWPATVAFVVALLAVALASGATLRRVLLPRGYSPGHRGARFSANAAIPSRRSADSAAVRQAASSTSRATSSGAPQPWRSACFAAFTATGEFRAMAAATSRAACLAWPAGTRRATRPCRSASSAGMRRPVSTRSAASPAPSLRGASCVPPPPGTSPTVTSGRPNTAVSSATMMSQLIANSQPPPRAYPCTAATVGCGRFSTPPNAARTVPRWRRSCASVIALRSLRSAPAQNARVPAALSTTARTVESAPSPAQAAAIDSAIAVFIAFIASGRLNSISATWLS